jgi:hypothetical protein
LKQAGCADKSVAVASKNVINLVVIPTAVVLGIQFFAILAVPFLIGKAGSLVVGYDSL